MLCGTEKLRMKQDPRQHIYERDNFTCRYCGWSGATSFEQWQLGWFAIDHVSPIKHGGKEDDDTNLVVACHRCNSMKGQEPCSSVEAGKIIIARKRAEREAWFKRFVLKA
ncbi:MAG: hypothetical protein B7X10_00380 [Burkholderiales bacterium 21-58-4]|nr:MAG: hypothetical protein B7X10_00380 [Burkholderiales bacterium 21-58-4]